MRYLLDTSVFLQGWMVPERLGRRTRELLGSPGEECFLSAVSSWEISIKYALGKLDLPEAPSKYVPTRLSEWRIQRLDISHDHALFVGELPQHHQDPFDRMLVAQAKVENMTIVTADRILEKYPIEIFRATL